MSFATGFFTTATKEVQEKQDYARNYRAKTRDYLMTYGTQAVTGAKSKVNDYVSVGMQLEGMGLEKDDLNYLVETSGPSALTNLYARVKDYTPDELTPKVFRSMVQRTKDYSTTSTYEQTIAKAFGLYKDNVTDDPAKNEGIAHFASMLFNPMAGASSETYIDGYNESDIRRIQGTVAPGMTAPLPVDFSKLPKRHSTTALGSYATSSFARMIDTSQTALDKLDAQMLETPLSEGDQRVYNKLKVAIKAEDYRTMIELVPETGAELLRMDKETGSGLSNNPFFTFEPGMQEFFVNTAAKLSGDNSYLEGKWNNAKKLYPDIGPLNSLKTFTTQAEARAAGVRYFILGGAIRINDAIPAGDVETAATKEAVKKVETGLELPKVLPTDTPAVTDERKTQILAFDVPTTTEEGMNPVLTGWTNLSLDALETFDSNTPYSANKSKEQNRADKETFDAESATMEQVLDTVGDYLEADAGGADEAKRIELADKMVLDIQSAPERVRVVVESLLDKLESGDYNSEAVDRSFTGQVQSGFKSLSNFLGGSRFNTDKNPDSTEEVNDPQAVREMGKIPFTDLNPVAATDSATRFESFDDVRAQLKSGELKQDDVILFRGKYLVVDQSKPGAIGKINEN